MVIRITDPKEERAIRAYAIRKKLPISKAVSLAVKESDQLLMAQGEIATCKFMLKVMKEDYYNKKP